MSKKVKNIINVIIALILIFVSAYLIKNVHIAQSFANIVTYIALAIGTMIFGHGMGNIIQNRAVNNDPDIKRNIEISKKDERNIAIAHKAKAKAFDFMSFVLLVLVLIFAWLKIDIRALVLLIFSYLFILGYALYYRFKFEKEM